MSLQDNLTTLVCLFHTQDRAQDAFNDLAKMGISQAAITRIGGPDAPSDALGKSELAALGMPDRDYEHLKDGIRNGGIVVAVHASEDNQSQVEEIFHRHSADKIDESMQQIREAPMPAPIVAAPLPVVAAAAETTDAQTIIPIVEENLVVGKRTVNQGGVRVFRRTIEIPVEQNIGLREEHVTMERRPVNRPVTDLDTAFGDRTVELTETAEEAVVAKNARVVEELLVGKASTERTETIHDTVRRTEVDVEELPGSTKTVDSLR